LQFFPGERYAARRDFCHGHPDDCCDNCCTSPQVEFTASGNNSGACNLLSGVEEAASVGILDAAGSERGWIWFSWRMRRGGVDARACHFNCDRHGDFGFACALHNIFTHDKLKSLRFQYCPV
jgi:hypothetical protein